MPTDKHNLHPSSKKQKTTPVKIQRITNCGVRNHNGYIYNTAHGSGDIMEEETERQ